MRSPLILIAALALAACGRPAEAPAAKSDAAAATIETAADTGDQRAQAAGRALIGAHAPELALRTIDGEPIDLAAAYDRKPVYLKFWATWCVPCREQMPHFERAFETLGQDVAVIAVNTNFNETVEGVKAYREKHGLKMPIVIDDGRLASALKLRVTPTHVLVDRTGRIVFVGHSADKALDDALQALKAPAAEAVAPGRTAAPVAPAVQTAAVTATGERFPFADPAGRKPTALVFFASWCEGYLKDSQPDASAQCRSAREQADRLAAGGGVRLIGVASGLWANRADLADYATQNRVAVPLTLDASGDLFRGFGVTRSPTIVVLGPDGRELRRFTGAEVAGFSQWLEASQGGRA
jgi:thiol-disulfide isomerase/thioredoxin